MKLSQKLNLNKFFVADLLFLSSIFCFLLFKVQICVVPCFFILSLSFNPAFFDRIVFRSRWREGKRWWPSLEYTLLNKLNSNQKREQKFDNFWHKNMTKSKQTHSVFKKLRVRSLNIMCVCTSVVEGMHKQSKGTKYVKFERFKVFL